MQVLRSIPRVWRLIAGAVAIVVLIAVVYLVFASGSRAAPQQPVGFNHQVMVDSGIQCLYCHNGATRGPVSGIPSVEKCMGCHTFIVPDHPEVQKLAGYWERQEPIPWARVYKVPRFVFFNHSVHLNHGFNCERCHGDVGNMTEVRPVVEMNMGWCLNCHNDQPNAAQLRDCVVCHR